MLRMRMKLFSAFFLLHLLVIMFSLRIFPSQGQSQLEWGTTYLIATHADGSALLIIEQRILGLSNISYYSSGEYLQTFSENASRLVGNAWVLVGRDMEAKNFRVTATVSQTALVSSGKIRHEFDWVGFAETRDERLIIGDVFIEEFFFLGNGSFFLEYPREYHVVQVSPTPDELMEDSQLIAWYSVEDFEFAQANIIVEKETSGASSFVQEYTAVFVGSITLVGIGSVSLWFFKFRNRRKHAPSPLFSFEVEDEEEKVVKLLKAANGPIYQSIITKQLGFSRSKTSKLLTSMESKKIVVRKKKGRDKVVVLKE